MDVGTSGLHCQAIDLETEETVATITQRHPTPGINVIDRVNYAIKSDEENATGLIRKCANQLFHALGIDLSKVVRIGVYGNTFQMSLFQGIEVRDLTYAGKNMLERLGVVPSKRNGASFPQGMSESPTCRTTVLSSSLLWSSTRSRPTPSSYFR